MPEYTIPYLPLTLQSTLKNFEKINGKIYLPKSEVQQLIIEAEAQMMSEQALRNDPQGRGFHGGDPELRAPITSDPRERRGREFKGPDDIYGSKPDVYRSIIIPEEGDTSPIFYPKYLGEGVGFDPADQYKPGSPKETNMNILGYYDKDLDEIGLLRTTDVVGEYGGLFDNIAEETEAHEYIHRYGGKEGDAIADHQYIEQAFSDLEPVTVDNVSRKTEELLTNFLIRQEQREIMKNMDSFEKSSYINEQRQRIFKELISENNLQKQIPNFAQGGPSDLPDVGSIETNNNFNIGKAGAGLALSQFLPTSTALDLANKINLTPAQSAYASSMFAPGAGGLDAAGKFPSFPGRDVPLEQAFAGEPMPSIKENIAAGGIDRYLFAPLQGLGALGDAVYGIPVAGAGIGAALKTPVVVASILSGIAKAGKSSKALPIQKEMYRIQGDTSSKLQPINKFDLEGLPIDYEKLTKTQQNRRGFSFEQKFNQVDLDINEIDEIKDWVSGDLSKKNKSQEYIKDINPFIKNLEVTGLTLNSQAFLRKFADKNDNIKVYRYLNIGEGGGTKLNPEKGIVSTTIDPHHAVGQGLIEKTKNIVEATEDYVPPSLIADPFEKTFLQEKALKEGTLKKRDLVRDTYVLEYDIPIEKVKAYIPAVFASIPKKAKQRYVEEMIERDYDYNVEEMIEEMAENQGVDIDDIERYYAVEEVDYRYQLSDELEFELTDNELESEVIADLKNIQPTAIYNIIDKDTIKLVKDPTKTKLSKGGPTVIDGLPVVNPVADVGSITPISPFEMTETFGGPLYQMLNPSAKRMVDKLGLRGQGLSGIMAETFGPGGKIKLSKAALAKIKPLLKERKVQRRFEESTDPNEKLGAQTKIKQIEKKIDKIIADDQS